LLVGLADGAPTVVSKEETLLKTTNNKRTTTITTNNELRKTNYETIDLSTTTKKRIARTMSGLQHVKEHMKWELLLSWIQESKKVIQDEEEKVRALEVELRAVKSLQAEGDKSQQSLAQEIKLLKEENATLQTTVDTQAKEILSLTATLTNVKEAFEVSEQRAAELQLQVTRLTSSGVLQSDNDMLRLSASEVPLLNNLATHWEKCFRFVADPEGQVVEPKTIAVIQSGTSFQTHEDLTHSTKLIWDVCNGDIQTGFVLLNGQEPLRTGEYEEAMQKTKKVSAILSGVMRSICFQLKLNLDIWKKRVFFFYQPQLKLFSLTPNNQSALFFNVAWTDPNYSESSEKLFWLFQFFHALSLSSGSLKLASHSLGLPSFISWMAARTDFLTSSAQICKTIIKETTHN